MVQEHEFLDVRLGMWLHWLEWDCTDLEWDCTDWNENALIWNENVLVWNKALLTRNENALIWNEVSLCTLRTTLGAVFQIFGYVLSPSLIFSERGQCLRSFSCNWEMEGSRDLDSSLRSDFLAVLSGLAGITGFIFSSTVGVWCSSECCCFLGCGLAARGSVVEDWGAFRDNLRTKKEVRCKVNSTLL